VGEISVPSGFDFSRKVIVVEDSTFLSKVVCDALKKVGFNNVVPFYNGKEAWTHISALKGTELKHTLAALISDIEMPQMDGHSLVRLIRQEKEFSETPVVMFSSLIHDNVRQKGEDLGANAQFSRSQLDECIKTVVELMNEYK